LIDLLLHCIYSNTSLIPCLIHQILLLFYCIISRRPWLSRTETADGSNLILPLYQQKFTY